MDLLWVIPVAAVLTILFVIYLAWDVLRRDTGTKAMQEIGGMIYEGAMAFLKRQYQTILILAVVVGILITLGYGFLGHDWDLAWRTGLAFLVGAGLSAVSGFTGMFVAVKSNLRTAAAAQRSLGQAITTAMRGGAVSGFLVVALSLIGVYVIFMTYGGSSSDPAVLRHAPSLIVGFGFGASFVALFAQLGGGIYTKAADVGADLVGKVEAGIPEDDPRNAAVIADLVGDNVGDCAGRGADLFESTAAENIGAMILGVAIFLATNNPVWIFFPLVIRAFGLIACIVGLLCVRVTKSEDIVEAAEIENATSSKSAAKERKAVNPMAALNRGYYVSAILSVIAMALVSHYMLNTWWFAAAGVVGIVLSIVFVYLTQYYTSGSWRPVKEIAEASLTGPGTNIITGTAVGYETTAGTAIAIGAALLSAYWFGEQSGVVHGGIFGTAIATMGMLMTAAYILAMDTFGPITDNAGGITEMSHAPEQARQITDAMDTVGNTTKALTKGYAIASAGLAAFLLFQAYLDRVKELQIERGIDAASLPLVLPVNLSKVEVFVGALLGAMLVYLFSSLAIRSVGKAASDIIQEVRRQFRENPGIMDGTVRPDFARVVDITTSAALRQMVAPGILAIGMPIVVGILLKWEAEAGLLMVGTIAGILLATTLNNGGGAWDNAKKYIESGFMKGKDGQVIGKGSPAHAAAVVGDTVGDPFKDTAGPSLHVLIKLLSTITLVLAPLFV